MHEIIITLRQLRRSPRFTVAAVLVLALGVGSATGLYSFADAALVRPLIYRDAGRLVIIRGPDRSQVNASLNDFKAWKTYNRSFEDLAAANLFTTNRNAATNGTSPAERARVREVTPNYFTLLGVTAEVGRVFLPSDGTGGTAQIVVLSYGFWKTHLGGDLQAVGKQLYLDGRPHEIVGVLGMASGFESRVRGRSQRDADVWTLLSPPLANASLFWLSLVGRLNPGVTRAQAAQEMTSLMRPTSRQASPGSVVVDPLRSTLVRPEGRAALLVLLAASGLMCLIAWTNFAMIIFARNVSRRRDFFIRLALGAPWTRLLRVVAIENLLLALFGGSVGIVVGSWLTALIKRLQPDYLLPTGIEASVNHRVALVGFILALIAGLLFGMVPAMRVASSERSTRRRTAMLDQHRGAHWLTFGEGIIVAEVALAVVLLTGAGLMLHSFIRLVQVDIGFRQSDAVSWKVELPAARYPSSTSIREYQDALVDRLRTTPTLRSVALCNTLPLSSGQFSARVLIPGTQSTGAMIRIVTPEYFEILGIRLMRGRLFNQREGLSGGRPILINETLAQEHFPNSDAVGQSLIVPMLGDESWSIVGITVPVRFGGARAQLQPELYVPLQLLSERALTRSMRTFTVLVRARAGAEQVLPVARYLTGSIDPRVGLFDVQTVSDIIQNSLAVPRFQSYVLSGFSITAWLLVFLGVYGIVSYSVNVRASEMAIRVALGATPSQVIGLVVRRELLFLSLGVLVGSAGSWVLARTVRALLFGVAEHDPFTFTGVIVAVVGAGLLACYVPSRRISRIDPCETLRQT